MNSSFQNLFSTDVEISALECSEKFNADIPDYFSKKAIEVLDEKFSEYDEEQIKLASREILLSTFDKHWKDHLLAMDHMKEGINLNAYAQRDPLTEYKSESFRLFEEMRGAVKKSIVESIFTVRLYSAEEIEELKRQHQEELERQLEAHKQAQAREEASKAPITRGKAKVGRNDPCPCGSGKKYKQCHGA